MTGRGASAVSLAIVLAAAILLPASLLVGEERLPNGDEAVLGLMALKIRRGEEFPLVFWQAHYSGPVSAYLGALLFAAAGTSPLLFKAVVLPFGLLAAAALGTLPGFSLWMMPISFPYVAASVWTCRGRLRRRPDPRPLPALVATLSILRLGPPAAAGDPPSAATTASLFRALSLSALAFLHVLGHAGPPPSPPPPPDLLAGRLETLGVRHAYADYFTAFPVTFLSGERVVVSPAVHARSDDRRPAYTADADRDANPAFVFATAPSANAFERALRDRGISFAVERLERYRIYRRLSARIRPLDLGLDPDLFVPGQAPRTP